MKIGVAGYDLLNEPNWDLPGGTALRNLYMQCTDSIRSVDPDHVIFIEGNWWANDFSGLTPPWDDNLVYSPHKYWSINDEGSMQFAVGIRDAYDVPLYLGESGENSNVWFRDAIHLLEGLGIGWAWWPLKKVESISAPLSVEKTPEYQTLLDYWSGSAAQPTEAFCHQCAHGFDREAEDSKLRHPTRCDRRDVPPGARGRIDSVQSRAVAARHCARYGL